MRPDPLTAAPELLAHHLRDLQRRYQRASHELDWNSAGIDPDDLAWWRLAYSEYQQRSRR